MEASNYSRRRFPENARRRITAKLVRGRASAARLQILLRSAAGTENDGRALIDEISSCFTEAISVLEFIESAGDELSCPDHSLCSDLDSGESRRRTAVKALGRGNKRRRVADARTVTSPTTEDSHAWRKYGQKVILNTAHPRSYYRCTHMYDQGCRAKKHVQKMEGDSEMYKITYISDHTCGPVVAAAEQPPSPSGSFNICFSNSRDGHWPSDDEAAKKGETTSSVTDEMDLWSALNDFGNLPETTVATMMNNQYCFSTGDDANSSRMFWDEF